MKGVIFNLLEDAVVREHGVDAWESLLQLAGLEGSYTSLGSYPDSEIVSLVDACLHCPGLADERGASLVRSQRDAAAV